MILTSDWHLTDSPEDEYRWNIFGELEKAVVQYGDRQIFMLGDICDRKDRHSGALVNRLVEELTKLSQLSININILMGNHDRPLNGPPFWRFLNEHSNIRFYERPTLLLNGSLLMLPYSANPVQDWKDLLPPGDTVNAIFMHQTVSGVRENGFTLTNNKMPELSTDIPIYSGDIHTPQKVGPVTYVGAPHPVKFGDSYECRMLLITDQFRIRRVIDLTPPRKSVAEISSLEELDQLKFHAGDQLRIRWRLPAAAMDDWSATQLAVQDWVTRNGVTINSLEPIVMLDDNASAATGGEDHQSVFEAFGAMEGISGDLLKYGETFLEEPARE
jgi:UDP-2,3-diacylglucosamine pyrophosphatase LpxH